MNNCFLGLSTGEQLAATILGEGKVLSCQMVCQAWKEELPRRGTLILPSEKILRQCANENLDVADWRLAYVIGHSLREQYKNIGDEVIKQPCFSPAEKLWLQAEHDCWANKTIVSGYRLLNFKLLFRNQYWHDQESNITKLGPDVKRAEGQAVSEVIISNFLVNDERLMPGNYHWSDLQAFGSEYHVYIGSFPRMGLIVRSNYDYHKYCGLGVVIDRRI